MFHSFFKTILIFGQQIFIFQEYWIYSIFPNILAIVDKIVIDRYVPTVSPWEPLGVIFCTLNVLGKVKLLIASSNPEVLQIPKFNISLPIAAALVCASLNYWRCRLTGRSAF